jgi:hypothetical protein
VEFQIPLHILQRRWSDGDHLVEQGLVEWSHMPISLATWENLEQLRQQFPRAPAWGQAASEEEGNVSSSEDAHREQAPSGPARPRRQARPNARLVGPEWV